MSRLFLVVRSGPSNECADDLLIVDDEALLRDVGRLLARRLGLSESHVRALRPVPIPEADEKNG
jgi:hypothetical protein